MASGIASWESAALVVFAKIVASCCSAACWLSVVGDNGDAAAGFWSARMRSCAAAVAASAEEDAGMVTLDGNQTRVLVMRSA